LSICDITFHNVKDGGEAEVGVVASGPPLQESVFLAKFMCCSRCTATTTQMMSRDSPKPYVNRSATTKKYIKACLEFKCGRYINLAATDHGSDKLDYSAFDCQSQI
jgi:hypothetical protein